MKLTDRNWGVFCLSEIFDLYTGKGKGLNHLTENEHGISYLGATNKNNAVLTFVNKEEKLIQKGNCIAFIRNGEGSMGYSVYKAEDFIATSDITVGYSPYLNKYNGMFITTMADKVRGKYNFNYKRSDTRLAREQLKLPINSDGNPDWKFMEQYGKEQDVNKKRDYIAYINNELKYLKHNNIQNINDKKWKEFFISGEDGIFNISSTSSGIDKNKLVLENENAPNEIPYITRTDENNGINLFIPEEQKNKYKMDKENVITIGLDTQTVFYQPHKFYTGQNIQILSNESLNKYNALFIIPLLKIQMDKFNWGGNGATLGRLNRTKIMLPVNDKNEPDYDYMEKYIKNSMRKKYTEYISFIK